MKENAEKKTDPMPRDDVLSIELTTRCNNDCLHCFVRKQRTKDLSLSPYVVKQIISEGYALSYRRLHLTGGEPLVWNGLFTILDFAFDLGIKTVFLNSNGTLLNDSISTKLAAYDGLSMSVSLEGTKQISDRIRGAGSFRKAYQGAESALDKGIDLTLFITVFKSVLPILYRVAGHLYNNFPDITFLTLNQFIGGTDEDAILSDELIDPDEFIQWVRIVALLNRFGLTTRVLNDPLANVVAKRIQMPWIPQSNPLYRDGSIIVMADGNIGLSHSSKGHFGKFAPGMLEKVLNSSKYKNAVSPDESTCPSCKYNEWCVEFGMVRPWEIYRDVAIGVPYCTRVLSRVVD